MQVRAAGNAEAKIAIVGEYPSVIDERRNEPLVSDELTKMMHEAGLIRTECYLTLALKQRPAYKLDNLWTKKKGEATKLGLKNFADGYYFSDQIKDARDSLLAELEVLRPNVIIALGNFALWMLTGNSGLDSWRGSLCATPSGVKVIATHSPSMISKQWELRALAVHDLRYAEEQSAFPEIRTPDYRFTVRPSFQAVMETIANLQTLAEISPLHLSVDIETRSQHIACVGFAWSRLDALCIPFMCVENTEGYWSLDEELAIWSVLKQLFTHSNVRVSGQNFAYDAQYFAKHWGFVPNLRDDTMLMQHTCFAGLQKSLGFLASMYCEFRQYWKDEGKTWDPKIPEEQLWVYNCLAGDSQILMSDATYKQLKDISVGDTIYAFEETGSDARYARRLRLAIVTNKWESVKDVFRYVFSDGTYLDATVDHRLISSSGKHSRSEFTWKTCGSLKQGDHVVSVGKPEKLALDYEAAWFAGILDGEGTVGFSNTDGKCYPRIGFSQKPGLVLTRALTVLNYYGFSYRTSHKESATYIDINGGLSEQLRLLSIFRTSRILHNFREMSASCGLSGFAGLARPHLIEVISLGKTNVYDISTTESTFIANGIVVHNCKDCVNTFEIAEVLSSIIDKLELRHQYTFQMDLWYSVFRMMLRGVRIDQKRRAEVATELFNAIALREQWLYDITGTTINPKSPKQMQDLFYSVLGMKPIVSRKTHRITCDDDALQTLKKKEPLLDIFIRPITEIRSLGVFLSTFVQAPLDTDKRMRCSYNIAGTETYRFSSSANAFDSGTNLQNLPKGHEAKTEGAFSLPNVRKLFIPDPGCTIFDVDLDRADLQVVVWEADDADLKAALREGLDLHLLNAQALFNLPFSIDDLRDPEILAKLLKLYARERQFAKSFVHGTNYGGSPRTMAIASGVSTAEAERAQRLWFTSHPGIKEWHHRTERDLMRTRQVTNRFGYRRFYFERIEGLLPEALAWQPQSTVAIVTNRVLQAIDTQLPSVEILLQVHDSLVFQIPNHLVSEMKPKIKALTETIIVPYSDPLCIPWGIKSSTISWGDVKDDQWL